MVLNHHLNQLESDKRHQSLYSEHHLDEQLLPVPLHHPIRLPARIPKTMWSHNFVMQEHAEHWLNTIGLRSCKRTS